MQYTALNLTLRKILKHYAGISDLKMLITNYSKLIKLDRRDYIQETKLITTLYSCFGGDKSIAVR